jgi:hypothetical protein
MEFSQQIFEKSQCGKFNENPTSGIRVVPWSEKDRERKTDGQT